MKINSNYLTKKQPKLRFRGFNEPLNENQIKELTKFMKSGGTPKSGSKDYYSNDGYNFISIDDMSNKYLFSSKKFITERALNETSTFLFEKENILYSIYATIGNICINKIDVALPQSILGIKPLDNINLEYFYYLLLANKKRIIKLQQVGSQPNISLKIFQNIKLFIANLYNEQEKIANFLSLLDKQIDLYVRKLELTEKNIKHFLKNAIIETSEENISKEIEIIDGYPFNSSEYSKDGVPIYTISNIGENEFISSEYNRVNILLNEKYKLRNNDIFCSLTGEKGFKCLIYNGSEINYINQRTIKITSNKIDSKIILLYLNKNVKKINSFATGTQKNISKNDLYKLPLVLNSKNNKLNGDIFFKLLKNKKLLKETLITLNQRKKYYLSNLFI